eukprot:1962541-Rhodomonas_salina.1
MLDFPYFSHVTSLSVCSFPPPLCLPPSPSSPSSTLASFSLPRAASQSTTLLNATQPDLTAPGTKTAEQRAKEVAKAKEKKKGEDGDVTEAEEQTLHVMI